MNKKQIYLLSLILFISLKLFAEFVSEEKAEKVGRSFFYQAINSIDKNKLKWDDIFLTCLYSPDKYSDNLFYIFNVNDNNGYILISSNSSITPILAYSFESGFNFGNISAGQQLFLDYYSESIKYAFENKLEATKNVAEQWNYYYHYKSGQEYKSKNTVLPLLGPIEWGQSWPYNAMLPPKGGGLGGNVPVGCSATSMLQMMKYYDWPSTGEGTVYHYSSDNGNHGDFIVNFSQQTYDWTKIPNKASSNYNEELAKINFHAGVATRMYWTANGSGASTIDVVYALINNFKYSTDIQLIYRGDYNDNNWKNILRHQIDSNLPMIYVGYSTSVGHAWNCDGYQGNDYFHMNWGWSGSGNGFYTLENLVSTATPGGEEYNFIYYQQAVIDIYPRENYPEFCSETKIITGSEGSFEDGSSYENYLPDTYCTYIINPECGNIINLNFYKFNLAENDFVEVYEGKNDNAVLIETFNNNNIPENNIVSNKGALTIKFYSDSNTTDKGWGVDYSVNFCGVNIVHNQPSGSFDDGSGICEYQKQKLCSWIIKPDDVNFITLEFEEFDLAGGADFVRIFENSISGANTIATYTASNPPTEQIYVPSGVAVIQFFSDSGNVGQGWKINYTSGITLIEEYYYITNINILPNPGNVNSNIFIESDSYELVKFSVYDLNGKILSTNSTKIKAGLNSIKISEIINKKLKNGTYLINIKINNQTYSKKFVLLN